MPLAYRALKQLPAGQQAISVTRRRRRPTTLTDNGAGRFFTKKIVIPMGKKPLAAQ